MTLKTSAAFARFKDYADQIEEGGIDWLSLNRATVLAWAAAHGITQRVESAINSDLNPRRKNEIAPVAVPFEQKGWQGPHANKPWHYEVTVAIPVIDSPESAAAIVRLLRLQTHPPFIMLIDTGSSPKNLAALQSLEAADVEVHSLRFAGVRHPSDFPAIAMDLAFSACRTEFLLATHADCFLMSSHVIEDLTAICSESEPVVGYELTERPHSDWRGMVGHTLTIFHMPTMDEIDAAWSLRKLLVQFKHPDKKAATHEISPSTSPNWPDTELLLNYQLRRHNLKPRIIGTEKNAARTIDDRLDHCRSVASATLYSEGSDYHAKSQEWLKDGIEKANKRADDWMREYSEGK